MKQINLDDIKPDFSLLNQPNLHYFDNACQTLRPRQVITAMTQYYEEYPACGGRSMHRLAAQVTKQCEAARQLVADYIGAKRKDEIVFTRNTTEGINLVANSLNLKAGDVILTTDKEHNSNLIPWQILAKKLGIVHVIVPSKSDNTFDLEAYKQLLEMHPVKLVSMAMTSNLDGVSIPADQVVALAHQHQALVLFDGAQAVPHHSVNVHRLDVDFLAFSGHKMLGPSGIGVLYGKFQLLEDLNPFLVGGDTVSSSTYTTQEFLPPPEKFEAGLQDYAGIIGLGAAITYLTRIGLSAIEAHELELNTYVTKALTSIKDLKILGPGDPKARGGIVSFYIPGKDHHQIALMLDESAGFLVRSGQHCVHSWFAHQQIPGTVRASFYFYNTMEEAKAFVQSLQKVVSIL